VTLAEEIAAVPYFYHRIELPGGVVTPGWAPIKPELYRIPADLTGKRVLDVGAWDGYWSFEAAKRGASEVWAIDDFSDTCGGDTNADRSKAWQTFDICNRALGFKNVRRFEFSVYDIEPDWHFDVVFCFGVLYHLKHPLLALEKLREVCTGEIYIETAILNGCQSAYGDRVYGDDDFGIEFYPNDEYGKNPSNWWVCTLRSWTELVRTAGFTNNEAWKMTDNPQHLSECRGFIRAEV
jgi:tRNA (mo5U34)-methyltransferase